MQLLPVSRMSILNTTKATKKIPLNYVDLLFTDRRLSKVTLSELRKMFLAETSARSRIWSDMKV